MSENIDSLYTSLDGRNIHNKNFKEYIEYRNQWRNNPKNFIVEAFPLHLDIEVTAQCNLRCKFCRTTYNHDSYPKNLMDVTLFKRIIDQGQEYGLKAIKFNWRGEPLLHPELPDMILYAKEKGILDVFFNTNAQLMNPSLSERLVKSGLDRITISIEGHFKEIYEKNRIGANFENLLYNIRNLNEIRLKLNSVTPKIRIQTVLIPEMKNHVDDYQEFWCDLCDEVACLRMKQEVEYSANQGRVDSSWSCPQLWQRMVVACDGTIIPCNEDHKAIMRLGNAKDTNIKDIWTSANLNRIRAIHQYGESHILSVCSICPLRAGDIDEKIKESI